MEELLNKKQVAQHFSVTTRTVDNWTKAGVLKSYSIGNVIRFKRKEVENAIK
jgi:excisionase family DNA binding protein